ncbi:MAG: class I SAM-dependent methyltransferase [Candidatus Omnitrophica bacterium]|nr:class I SAM-dependent methyltransferase [Candidatus Omnitrophota bacterium]
MKNKNNNCKVDLNAICKKAVGEGLRIDLSGCQYEEPSYPMRPKGVCDYYCFLAGLVRSERLTSIVEIGTGYGGSIKAISTGLHPDDRSSSALITVDIEQKNKAGFVGFSHIKRITGDALNRDVIHKVSEYTGGSVDILFIDANHTYLQMRRYIAVYANRFKPRFVVIDDIHFSWFTDILWKELELNLGENALDITDLLLRGKTGIGIVYWGQRQRFYWHYSNYITGILNIVSRCIIRMKRLLSISRSK